MIVFLTLIYIVLLVILAKVNVIKMNLWWKISPIVWVLVLFIGLFIPMQFWAPSGSAMVVQYSVPIVPNVSGQVIEVAAKPNVDLKKGDLLFKIEPEPFEAALEQVQAQLALAKVRLADAETLFKTGAGSESSVQRYQAQVAQFQAGVKSAKFNLAQTEVRAPADGFVTNLALRAGTRVASFPISQAMAFVENSERLIAVQIPQSYVRFLQVGQSAELTFKLFPGVVYPAQVVQLVRANAAGQMKASGDMIQARQVVAQPFVVKLRLQDEALMNSLPAGAVASAAIYTEQGAPTHIIRKVMIRMDAFMNYIKPV